VKLAHESQGRNVDLLWPVCGGDLRGKCCECGGGEKSVLELRVAEEGDVAFANVFVEARDDDLGAKGESSVGLCETRVSGRIMLQNAEDVLGYPEPLD
jgi:hypothetical protein